MTQPVSLSPLLSSSVGFDRLASLFDDLLSTGTPEGFPPYDIEKLDADRYRITLAVAGFSETDLRITADQNRLVVKGTHQLTKTSQKGTYLHKGLAEREFERAFALADHMTVTGAELKDGLLNIDLFREVPDDLKPRRIEIRSGEELRAIGHADAPKRLS